MEIITLTRKQGTDWMLLAMYAMRKARGLGVVTVKEIDALSAYLEKNHKDGSLPTMTTKQIERIIGRQ